MTGDELRERYLLFGFSFETVVSCLLSRNLLLEDMIPNARKQFYDSLNEEKVRKQKVLLSYQESICRYMREIDPNNDRVSLNEIAKRHSNEPPGYMIQSWMRSRNTMEFLKRWEIASNPVFDCTACDKLIQRARMTSFTLTPTQWVRKTKAIGMAIKQGKGRGVKAHPDIATDFQMWLDPSLRLSLIRFMRENKSSSA